MLFRNPLFLIGFLVITILFSWSIIHAIFFDDHIEQAGILYADDGITPIDKPPYPPSWEYPLGTEKMGFSLMDQVIVGAKFTLGFALLIGLLRVVIALCFGILYGLYLEKYRRMLTNIVDVFHFIPVTLLAFFLLSPILFETIDGFAYSLNERILYEVMILTIIAIPTTSLLIGNEVSAIYKKDFIEGARVMWSGKLHIFKRHILPHLLPKLWIVFMQQMINVLLVLAHLGIFKLFFGGTHLSFGNGPKDPPSSLSYEWSGLIGNYFRVINGYPWMAFTPIVLFAITILSLNFILHGIKDTTEKWQIKTVKKQNNNNDIALNQQSKQINFEQVNTKKSLSV
jgi:peptide/nickel transport system permease protein